MKVQKKKLLIEREAPFIVRQTPNEKHNEVTVARIHYALPVANITRGFSMTMLHKIKKAVAGFPDANVEFKFVPTPDSPSFLFTCKGKTERRGDDIHNQELADKIALAKCRAKACAISLKLIKVINDVLKENVKHCDDLQNIFTQYYTREYAYIQKVKA